MNPNVPSLASCPGAKVSIHVVVDGDSLLSVVHEPGTPMGGYLQVASDGAYLAIEVRDLRTARRLRDLSDQLLDRLIDADLRRRVAIEDHPSSRPTRPNLHTVGDHG